MTRGHHFAGENDVSGQTGSGERNFKNKEPIVGVLPNPPPLIVEDVEPMLPPKCRIMTHSHKVLSDCMERFLYHKKYQLSMENVAHYCKNGTAGCARVNSVYTPRSGKQSHVKTMNKDQYWAEMEKQFPFLKEIQENGQ